MKYSPTLALTIVKKYQSGLRSQAGLCREFGADPKDVCLWIALHNMYGDEVFNTEQNFSEVVRQQIIEDKLHNGLSIQTTCVKYKILRRSTLRNWMRIYKKESITTMLRKKRKKESLPGESATAERIKQLEDELFLVKAENAFLKKLQALMLETNSQRRNKK